MSDLKDMLLSLCTADGTPGREYEIGKKITEYVPKGFTADFDNNGNLICRKAGNSKKFLLDAHMDRIGLIVTSIEKGGFLHIDKCGGMDVRVLAAQEVIVHGKEDLYGVITSTPPHLTAPDVEKKAANFDEILIDTGLSDIKLKELVSLGDRVTLKSPVLSLQNDLISAASLDNRAGCAAILMASQLICERNNDVNLTLLFSAQEETGGSGAVTGSYDIDADECISVDVSFAQAHDVTGERYGKIGMGPMIGISPVLDYSISTKLRNTADEKGIPYQLEIMGDRTSTNADHITLTRSGIKTSLISIPQRNMHTGVEIVSLSDIKNTAELIAQYIIGGGIDA